MKTLQQILNIYDDYKTFPHKQYQYLVNLVTELYEFLSKSPFKDCFDIGSDMIYDSMDDDENGWGI